VPRPTIVEIPLEDKLRIGQYAVPGMGTFSASSVVLCAAGRPRRSSRVLFC